MPKTARAVGGAVLHGRPAIGQRPRAALIVLVINFQFERSPTRRQGAPRRAAGRAPFELGAPINDDQA